MEEEKKGPGRPKGSKNKRSEEFRELLTSIPNFKHPGVFLAEIYMDDEQDVQLRVRAATELLPYMESKMKQIEIGGPDGSSIPVAYNWLPPTPKEHIPGGVAVTGSMDDLFEDEPEEKPDASDDE